MYFNTWWKEYPNERYWLEVTERSDLGVDLHAPELRDDGREYYGYSLINAIEEGDIILHYQKGLKAISMWSVASGRIWDDVVVWGAHGSTAVAAGVKPYARPGRRAGLMGSIPLAVRITLEQLRTNSDKIAAIHSELQNRHGGSLYFPFEISAKRSLRPTQAYLTKLPSKVIDLFPTLRSEVGTFPTRHRISEDVEANYNVSSTASVGTAYRRANEEVSVSERDPFSTDPSLVERAHRGHAITQNVLADYIAGLGFEPRSPKPGEPNYDLAWFDRKTLCVAEIKSVTLDNEELQLRIGLGQLLRYRYQLQQQGRQVQAFLVVEREPQDLSWVEICHQLSIFLVWPGTWTGIYSHDK